MRFAILISASVMILSGCASLGGLSKFKPEKTAVSVEGLVPQNTSWAEVAPEDLPTTDWIGSFSDPVLVSLVAEALEANTNIRSAAARVEAAQARSRISRADKLPTLDTNSRITRNETSIPFSNPTNIASGISANWEADLWGRIKNGIAADEFSLAASEADYAGARLSIAGQVAQGWFNVIEARLLSELSARDVETLERSLALTQRRFEGGVTGSSDVRLARSSVANAKALQASREQNLSALTRNLEIILRRYPSDEIDITEDLPNLPTLSGVATPGYVLRKRPDLLAAESRMRAQGLEVDVARKNLLPRLSFTGNGNLNATSFSDFFDVDALAMQLIGNFSAPLFQGGRLKGNIEQQEAILREQLESYAGEALNAYLEVENALSAEQRLLERENALRTSLEEAQKAESRLELRYTEGLATILQLLDAQSRRISAEGQLISARKERLANRVRMHIALGGGLETNLEPSTFAIASINSLGGVTP